MTHTENDQLLYLLEQLESHEDARISSRDISDCCNLPHHLILEEVIEMMDDLALPEWEYQSYDQDENGESFTVYFLDEKLCKLLVNISGKNENKEVSKFP